MAGLDFLYGGLGAADAITNLVAQRNFEAQQQQVAQRASQQQQFMNSLEQTKVEADAARQNAEAKALGAKQPKPLAEPKPLYDLKGNQLGLGRENSELPGHYDVVTPNGVMTYNSGEITTEKPTPAPKISKNIEPWTLKGGGQVMAYQDENGHLINAADQSVIDPNTILNKAPIPEAADVAAQRAASTALTQQDLAMRQSEAARRAKNAQDLAQSVLEGGLTLGEVPMDIRGDVQGIVNSQGGAPVALSQQGKARKEVASALLPKYEGVMKLASDINAMGLQGTVGSAWQKLVSGQSAASDLSGLTPEQKQTVGKFVTEARGLLISGTAMVHGGARGAGSPGMVNIVKDYLDPGSKDLDTYVGNLKGAQQFIGTYASMGEHAATGPTPPANPRPGSLWQPPNSKMTFWTGSHWAPLD